MTNRKGPEWEVKLRDTLRQFFGRAERLTKSGRNDEGDVAFTWDGKDFVIEAKNERSISLSAYVQEAEVEAENYAKARGIPLHLVHWAAVIKRRNHAAGKAYVVMTLDEWIRQVKR